MKAKPNTSARTAATSSKTAKKVKAKPAVKVATKPSKVVKKVEEKKVKKEVKTVKAVKEVPRLDLFKNPKSEFEKLVANRKSNYIPMPLMKEINAWKKPYTGASFFSGCGGSSTGHKMAGVKILYANEFVPAAQDTYEANHKGTYMDRSDIREVKASDVLALMKMKPGQLDLLDGSPPCSSYSSAGTRDKGWGKAKLYSDNIKQRTDDLFPEFIRILKKIKPKTFTIENVPGLAQGKAKGVFLAVMAELKACGYQVSCRQLVASYLGVPQQRNRLIFVGVRNDIHEMGIEHTYPTPLPGPQPTLRQAHPHIVALKGKTMGGVSAYVPSDIPCYTVLASDFRIKDTASFSFGAFVEDNAGERRKMTVKELKVVSSFPTDFKLTGTTEQKMERIGRAVPPLMMAFVTHSIIKTVLEPYYKRKKK